MAKHELLDPGAPLVAALGQPHFDRRLADKILAAFNHAYAAGEAAIAEQLHGLLADVEARARHAHPERRGESALDNAERWVGFVEARNRYRACSERPDLDPQATAEALEAMKQAYKLWSLA
jgi:hypothetical protein